MKCKSFVLLGGAREEQTLRVFKLSDPAQTAFTKAVQDDHKAWFTKHTKQIEFNYEQSRRSNELFQVKFDLPSVLALALEKKPRAVPAFEVSDVARVKALVARDGDRLILYGIDARMRYVPGTGIRFVFEKSQYDRDLRPAIDMPTSIGAVYENGHLYFRSEFSVRRFLNIDFVFTAATDEQLSEFAADPLFAPNDVDLETLANDEIRRRISALLPNDVMKDFDVAAIQEQAQKFAITLAVSDDGKLIIPDARPELNDLLDVLEDNLFEGSMSGKQFRSSRKRALNPAGDSPTG